MSRKSRKDMTIEDHYETASALREAEAVVFRLFEHSRWFYGGEVKKISSALSYISRIRNRLDNELFADNENLGREWVRLYYGEQSEADDLMRSIQR